MENDGVIENGELLPEKSEVSIEPVANHDVIQPANRVNPIQGLVNSLKGIKGTIQEKLILKKPIKSYGLGAYPPPQKKVIKTISKPQIKKVFPQKPIMKVQKLIAPNNLGQGLLFNNMFFETLLMIIIIYWLLRWLFSFDQYNY